MAAQDPKRLPDLIRDGPVRTVRFLVFGDGMAPARDYIERLKKKKATKAKAAALLRTAERLATEHQLPGSCWRKFNDDFWELVVTGQRMLVAKIGNTHFLVCGFPKKENKAPPTQGRKAKKIITRYLEELGQ